MVFCCIGDTSSRECLVVLTFYKKIVVFLWKIIYNRHVCLDISELPIKDAVYLDEKDVVTELAIEKDSDLIGKGLLDLFEKEENVTLLFIK
jgi:hypothetical protein